MEYEDFHTGMFQANLLYDIEIEEDDYEEIALIAWNRIGNKVTKLYNYSVRLGCNENSIQLPCNCYYLEAVTADEEDWSRTTNYSNYGDNYTSFTEQYIESGKRQTHPFYQKGHFLQFEKVGNTLYFKEKHPGKINILYHGIVADDEGLPMITRKETEAIAAFVAYTSLYKQGLKTKNGNIIKLAQDLELKWMRLCDAARVPEHLNQNEMNEALEAKHSWCRKTYGRSFKPLM